MSSPTSPTRAIEHGNIEVWRLANGDLHREDGPAVVQPNGDREWYSHDKRHREDGPAIEYAQGTRAWYRHGKRHRIDGPALTSNDGINEWIVDNLGVSDDALLLDRLYADGEIDVVSHVLASWHPQVDVSELVVPIYVALDRRPPAYVVDLEENQARLADIRQQKARRGEVA